MNDLELSPEADLFLGEATSEFNDKQEALNRDWGFNRIKRWDYDQPTGTFRLTLKDRSLVEADGQILGSFCEDDSTWEWAWNNPHAEDQVASDSRLVKAVGERLGIDYLQMGQMPLPDEEFVSYLTAIGLKATGAVGAYRGNAGEIAVILMLKNLRKVAAPEKPAGGGFFARLFGFGK